MPGSVRQSATLARPNPARSCGAGYGLPENYSYPGVENGECEEQKPLHRAVIPLKKGIHVWTRPDVKDVLKAKRSNAVMYPASAKLPCPDGIRAPGPHHAFGLNGLGSPQVFQELVRPVLPSVHHRILVGEFMFPKIPCV